MKKDNSTFLKKKWLRTRMLGYVDAPVVMETHGGYGRLFSVCYADIKSGVVFEKDPKKAGVLGLQRPTWSVYEADCIEAIKDGAGNHLPVNFLDIDPYGSPWDVIDAFFNGNREYMPEMVIVVNDGLPQKVKIGAAWHTHALRGIVEKYGNDIFSRYLEVCEELLTEKVLGAGYVAQNFFGYYTGHSKAITHYAAILKR